jgi:uncharacterized caspase-like protein
MGVLARHIGARWLAQLLVVVGLMLPGVAAANDLRGIALVIGQSEYEHLAPLANPANDADAIEELLSDLGFDTTLASDRDARQLTRVLEGFVEDAEDADVAILFYAGHGIEAGGENYLVPVDADFSALDAAAERLVPITDYLERLKATVPVTIVMLDACRDNPFPAGALVRAGPDATPVQMGDAGLAGETRGASRLTAGAPAPEETYGTVIAFAAEPGRAALDGEPGANSPYTAAVLRHLDAMTGQEFGTVMRIVAEEVYLNTGGQQQPWVNESLRRLLYFGEAPEPVDGPEGDILRERRGLLLTIADLSAPRKADARKLAQSSDVPMSVVFAMMKAAGIDRDEDPAAVERRLRDEIDRFAEARRQRDALTNPDDELIRLSALADEAELEGALHVANELRDQAKERVGSLRSTRDEQIAALRERIVEDAEIFARSAETKKLLFQHRQAAEDYGEARAIVTDWDREKAVDYRALQIAAYLVDGELNGRMESVSEAERLAREALASGRDSTQASRDLAVALMLRGSRSQDMAAVAEARELIDAALADADALTPLDLARLEIEAGRAVGTLALADGSQSGLLDAGAHFRNAIDASSQAGDRAVEAEARFRLVQSLYFSWSMAPNPERWTVFHEETSKFIAMFDGQEGDIDPLSLRYVGQIPPIMLELAVRQNMPDSLRLASDINGVVAELFERDRFPLIWAGLQAVEGRIGLEWSERFGDPSMLESSIEALRAALATFNEAGSSGASLEAELNLALTLASAGWRFSQPDYLTQAVDAFDRLATRDDVRDEPFRRRAVAFHRARVGSGLAALMGDPGGLDQPIATYTAQLENPDMSVDPAFRAQLQSELGKALFWQAQMTGADADAFRRGAHLLGEAATFYKSTGADRANVAPFTELVKYQADALASVALMTAEPDDYREAIAVNRDVHDRLAAIGQHEIEALAANTVAFLIAQLLRVEFDEDLIDVGDAMARSALASLDQLPQFSGYFRNTACELATERARHDKDVDLARSALSQCREALEILRASGNLDAIPTSERSIERAEALVSELEGR